ncbi:FAD-dependent oxidoreductase [Alloscardovia theropitheci]|uniref:FAD-dependent oxidoreductase n=1 Tax=Alloscardovia theropitheci TaxID=2496842 RepID=A0A4R0QN40_9BIFI|nr:FAD-dependent oxidoreductase [Alloscardovia theropitheci]TCD53593.1 FAD-dependent oxidoreductase [Alloscardovia theropitheci]
MAFDYDVIIIGSGPGGYATALRTSDLGLKTAVIEMKDVVGGTCLNRGCIPTKAYLTAAHTLHDAHRANNWGIDISVNSVDMSALKQAKDKTVSGVVKGLSQLMKARKIDIIHGQGSLIAPHRVSVCDGEDSREFSANHVVLATGSYATELEGFEFLHADAQTVREAIADKKVPILSSDEALDIDIMPENVVIVGSGTIAVEFANFWNSLGVNVTILLRKDTVLSRWDSHISSVVMRTLKRQGINFEFHSKILSAESGDVTFSVTSEKDGAVVQKTIPADFVLCAIGRSPRTDFDWYKNAGIKLDAHGFVVTDDYGRTSLDNVWALGDITGGHLLAHEAFEQALTVSESIAGIPTRIVDTHTIPEVVFGIIDAVSIGYTKNQAEALDYIEVEETVVPQLSNPRVAMMGSNGTTVIVSAVDPHTNTRIVIGIHMAGPSASELAGAAREIIQNRIPLHDAANALFAHPTISETLGESLLKADGRPLNLR